MAFPLTHLCVAKRIIDTLDIPSPELFLLGSIAPDAVHYRTEFMGATQSGIGPAKKITHLCPVSDEKWGQVTDNDGWVECVKQFLHHHPNDPFTQGYAVHVLTDIYNNISLWRAFITKFPEEAAKGYASDYYRDMQNIDFQIYNEFVKERDIQRLLQEAAPQEMPGLITADELGRLQHNLLHVQYANAPENVDTSNCFYVTYQQTLDCIDATAAFCMKQPIFPQSL